jgi:hypothetical protein
MTAFAVKNKKGRVDQKKTARLQRRLEKACKKINEVVATEISSFQEMVKEYEVDTESFRRAASHRAMLTLHSDGMEVYLSAEFGDLFGSTDLLEPTVTNHWVDIERLQVAKEKIMAKEEARSAKRAEK